MFLLFGTALMWGAAGCGPAADRRLAYEHARTAYERYEAGDYEGCVYYSSKAVARSPQYAEVYALRAHAELQLNNVSNALLDANAAVHMQPKDVAGLTLRAFVHAELGDLEAALRDAERAVKLDENVNTLSARVEVLGRMGDTDGVRQDLSRLKEIGPEDPTCLNALAWSMMLYLDADERDVDEVLAVAKKAVDLSERSEPAILDTYACALADAGRTNEALDVVREALALEVSERDRAEVDGHLVAFEQGEDWRAAYE